MRQHGVVLSLFPGADLLGRAFEEHGWCVVRGPDVLWGGDVRKFSVLPGRIDVVIGGPPCQPHSGLTRGKNGVRRTTAIDLIPEFMRIVEESAPRAAVMENVVAARGDIPGWNRLILRDWDCGGHTSRVRAFWLRGVSQPLTPPRRPGTPHGTVLASMWKSSWDSKKAKSRRRRHFLEPEQAAGLQGYPGLGAAIATAQPVGVSDASRRCMAVHMLGNGVPHALADFIARHVTRSLTEAP